MKHLRLVSRKPEVAQTGFALKMDFKIDLLGWTIAMVFEKDEVGLLSTWGVPPSTRME